MRKLATAIASLILTTQFACTHQVNAALVEKPLASYAAASYLPKYYPGEWSLLRDFIAYDFEGQPAAYIFVYRRADLSIADFGELEASIAAAESRRERALAKRDAVRTSDPGQDEERLMAEARQRDRALYRADDFATVITGAWTTAPVIYACEPGLPPFLAEKPALERRLWTVGTNAAHNLGRLIFLSAFDIRYEVIGPETLKPIRSTTTDGPPTPVDENEMLLSSKDAQLESAGAAKAANAKAREEQDAFLRGLEDPDRRKVEEGRRQGQLRNIKKWARLAEEMHSKDE